MAGTAHAIEEDMTTTNLDAILASALARLGHDRSARRLASLGGAKALCAAAASGLGLTLTAADTDRCALHLRAWLRAHP